MTPQSEMPLAFEFRRYLSGPSCPRCGDLLLAAEASEFLSEGRVRHFWACDACGQAFHTAVELVPTTPPSPSPHPA
jgi:transcription elongation factor Elf1